MAGGAVFDACQRQATKSIVSSSGTSIEIIDTDAEGRLSSLMVFIL
jgi:hypothetical protein